jgi:uncharacterized damage-inducible protein DinB
MDLLDRMLEHDRWATSTMLDVSRDLSDEQLDRSYDIGLGSLRATFGHIIVNVDFWTRLMTGDPIEYEELTRASIADLIQHHDRTYAAFAALARRLRDEQCLDDIFLDHYEVNKSFGGTILHVVLHNAEHRTEAVHILQRLGLPNVPEVDHGLWDYEMHNT